MKMNEAKRIMESNGIAVEERMTRKGSCLVEALSIGEGNIKPSIYEKTIENIETEEELMDMVESITGNVPQVNVDMLRNKEYVKEHCISCIRHETDDDSTIKWTAYGDLEEYIRIDLGSDGRVGSMSCVVTESLLDQLDMDAEELRSYGRMNLREHASIKGMREVLSGLMGQDVMGDMDEMMYVATVDTMSHGASVMLLDDMLREFCVEHNLESVVIIPSSLNEVLLVPGAVEDEVINGMIRDVNMSEVDEWEQLSDHLYRFEAVAA